MDTESIFERIARARPQGTAAAAAVIDHGNPAAWHGQKATTCIACKSDADVLAGLLASLESHRFLFGRFTALADVRGWITPKATGDEPVPPPASANGDGGANANGSADAKGDKGALLVETMAGLDARLRELYAALPARTALVIFTGHADPRRMAELNARKSAFESAIRSGKKPEELGPEARWTSADGRELEEEVAKARRGLLFLGVKDAGL